MPQRAEIVILFGGDGPLVIEIVSHSRSRNKFEVPKAAGVVRIHNRIEDDVYSDAGVILRWAELPK